MKNFVPDIYQKSIYNINYDKLKKKGIKCLLFDLDNTLVPYTEEKPTNEVKELFHILCDNFKVIIMSNSNKKRLRPFKEILNVDTAFSSCKPFKKKYLKIMKIYHLNPDEIACIGDQLITDIYGANRLQMLSILVNPIGTKEPIWTKINRLFENIILKKLKKNNLFNKGKYYE